MAVPCSPNRGPPTRPAVYDTGRAALLPTEPRRLSGVNGTTAEPAQPPADALVIKYTFTQSPVSLNPSSFDTPNGQVIRGREQSGDGIAFDVWVIPAVGVAPSDVTLALTPGLPGERWQQCRYHECAYADRRCGRFAAVA